MGPTPASALLLAAAAILAPAAPLQPGDPAPELTVASWLNVEKGKEPTSLSLKGKAVMVEFWGTWCGPCVRAMPHVQQVWDRYRDRGLVVLAVSYEAPEVMKPFLEKNALTMPVGSDPSKAYIGKFGFSGWPATFVIDVEGKIAYAGDPYGVEPAVEKALGLESGPPVLLTAWLSALGGKDAARTRAALERLAEKAPVDFDLKAWALAAGGRAPEAAREPHKVDAEKTLARVVEAAAAGKEDQRLAALGDLAAEGPGKFDLAAWVRAAFARTYPITGREMKALLDSSRFQDAVDALIERRPPADVAGGAAKHDGLRDYCRKKAEEARSFARKGLMALHWPMAGKQPKNNDAFWKDISVSGLATSEDKKRVTGILIGGEMVTDVMAPAWIDRQLGRALVMKEIGSSGKTGLGGLAQQVPKDRETILRELKSLYD
jgi:peroxiredoxin